MNDTGTIPTSGSYDSSPNRPSRVYIMKGMEFGRNLAGPPANTVCQSILSDNYYDLPSPVKEAFDGFLGEKRKSQKRMIEWANAFVVAWELNPGGALPTRSKGRVVRASDEDLPIMIRTLLALLEAGARGVTANEIKRDTGIISDGFSGALSDLHGCDLVSGLRDKRL